MEETINFKLAYSEHQKEITTTVPSGTTLEEFLYDDCFRDMRNKLLESWGVHTDTLQNARYIPELESNTKVSTWSKHLGATVLFSPCDTSDPLNLSNRLNKLSMDVTKELTKSDSKGKKVKKSQPNLTEEINLLKSQHQTEISIINERLLLQEASHEAEISSLKAEISSHEAEISSLKAEISSHEAEISILKQQFNTVFPLLETRRTQALRVLLEELVKLIKERHPIDNCFNDKVYIEKLLTLDDVPDNVKIMLKFSLTKYSELSEGLHKSNPREIANTILTLDEGKRPHWSSIFQYVYKTDVEVASGFYKG